MNLDSTVAATIGDDATRQTAGLGWRARLDLRYRFEQGRTLGDHAHEGPLRVLQALYPEGDGVCHHVLVHPPGGLVGGDVLEIQAELGAGSHAFVTTPGATRFYRTKGPQAVQSVRVKLAAQSRLEWLPLETIAYNGCQGESRLNFDLASGAEVLAWEVLALGLPQSDQPFAQGRFVQHMEVDGHWLDRGVIEAQDQRLLDGPLGWAGQRCLGTLVLAAGDPLSQQRTEQALSEARECPVPEGLWVGATLAHPHVWVLRVLGAQAEPVRALLQEVWARWRQSQWGIQPKPSRMWRV